MPRASKYPIIRALVDAEKGLRAQGRMGYEGVIELHGICCAVGVLARNQPEPYEYVVDKYNIPERSCAPLFLLHDAVVLKFGIGTEALDVFSACVKRIKRNPSRGLKALHEGSFKLIKKETK